MSEMVERVARAIFITRQEGLPKFTLRAQFDELDEASGLKRRYLAEARAAIEAMHTPTEAMCKAAFKDQQNYVAPEYLKDTARSYSYMIDAALK